MVTLLQMLQSNVAVLDASLGPAVQLKCELSGEIVFRVLLIQQFTEQSPIDINSDVITYGNDAIIVPIGGRIANARFVDSAGVARAETTAAPSYNDALWQTTGVKPDGIDREGYSVRYVSARLFG